jgi:hypothetical protein
MLTEYIDAAMRKSKYKQLGGGEGYFGTIPGFRGLWANARTQRACRRELRSVLEGWILVSLDHRIRMPIVDGLDINPKRNRARKKVA